MIPFLVGVGVLSMLVPIYIAEISPKNLRGRLGGLWQFFIVTGIAASYWVNYASKKILSDEDDNLWRIPLGLQLLPAILLALGILPMIESRAGSAPRKISSSPRSPSASCAGWGSTTQALLQSSRRFARPCVTKPSNSSLPTARSS